MGALDERKHWQCPLQDIRYAFLKGTFALLITILQDESKSDQHGSFGASACLSAESAVITRRISNLSFSLDFSRPGCPIPSEKHHSSPSTALSLPKYTTSIDDWACTRSSATNHEIFSEFDKPNFLQFVQSGGLICYTLSPSSMSFSARSIQTPNPVHPAFTHSVIPSLVPTTSHEYLSENLSRRSIVEPISSRWQALFTAIDIPETRSLEETRPSTASNAPGLRLCLSPGFCGADVVKQILEIREFGQQRRPNAATRDFAGRGNPSYLDNVEEGPLFAGSNGQVGRRR
ncbi:hypothetical protein C8J56DRAFT_1059625 [Mycena floridula]|nr:hypothetical protein C8J56DRAFT_1059625 [Mycena floridula]